MNISINDLRGWNREDIVFVDVRGEISYNHGHVDGAVSLEDVAMADEVIPLDKTKKYVVYCTYGKNSEPFVKALRDAGYDAYNLEGGFREWLRQNAENYDEDELIRYDRQIILPQIGSEGQLKLKNAKVLIVGAGGLGSPAALYLAGAGIGQIGIVDADNVSMTNLQRQIAFNETMLGENKAAAAKKVLERLNSKIKIVTYSEFLTPSNAERIISEYDFVVDGVDNFETKFLINDTCVLLKKPFTHAGILRFDGQVMTYVPGESSCYRCIFEEIPDKGSVPNCSEAGVIGAMAGTIGSIQALEVIKYFTGAGELLTNKMLVFDGLTMNTRIVKLPNKNPNCRVCGEYADIKGIKENAGEYTMEGCAL
ncbi:MAG: molybdopterin-synthase adenylyltransferase MoeB [Eubacterium sp.]|nr:molybdopterin-synthase adenylyltransferase MoeB [Eubacterium sp.]